jgi:protein-S-isoprenylcysteine O-methyltransferase Ste14
MSSQKAKVRTFGELRQIVVAAFAFLTVAVVLFLDELLDLPHLFFGTPATPFNWTEVVVECILVAFIGWLCIHLLSFSESRRRQVKNALRQGEIKQAILSVPLV